MAGIKNEGLLIFAGIVIVGLILANQGGNTGNDTGGNDGNTGGGVDLCKLVDGQVSFTGQDKYLAGTARSADWVRVIEINGENKKRDLGQISMNSGTLGVTPEKSYKLYFGENTTSTSRYTYTEDYKAPCQDATDNRVGYLCTVDTAPTVTVFDENGQVQSGTTNVQAMGASDIIDVEVKVKVAADKCYGNPEAKVKNAICFEYNGTVFDSVKANTDSSAIPYSVSSDSGKPVGYSQTCYALDLLADTGSQTMTVTLDASSTEPAAGGVNNINISLEDVDFDLNQDTLDEIWGFSDESNTNLGATLIRSTAIKVS